MRKRHYILLVSRDENGRLRKIPIPLHYAYGFVGAAVIGLFTITGMAGSYMRMLVKTERFNQVRQEHEALRKDYKQLEQVDHEKDIQAASLGSLAGEISALYGLKHNKIFEAKSEAKKPHIADVATADVADDTYFKSLDQFYALRTSAMSGVATRAISFGGLGVAQSTDDWVRLASAPSLWPVEGRVTSSFGEREDPFNGEGAFHSGVDIATEYGLPVRATADGVVDMASMANGYGREVLIDHGHGIKTLYGHLSGFAVASGQQVTRGQIIGYVGQSGRSTGPHLHYEVRIRDTPVNPHRYLRESGTQLALSVSKASGGQ